MRKDTKQRTQERKMGKDRMESISYEQRKEKINTEKAIQKKFHEDNLKQIISDNLKFQIKQRVSGDATATDIIKSLANKESSIYEEILEVVVKRTESMVKIKDLAAKRKIANGESERLINPKGDPLEKKIINVFDRLIAKLTAKINENNTPVAGVENPDVGPEL